MNSRTRIIFAICVLGLAALACDMTGGTPDPNRPAQLVAGENGTGTRAPKATVTPKPSPTIGYEATVAAAEAARQKAQSDSLQAEQIAHDAWSTAEAAHVTIISITAQAEQAQLALEQMTAQANEDRMQELSWTATAAPTSVPLTQTAQVADNARLDSQIAIAKTAIVLTVQAPTMIVAKARAQAEAKYAPVQAAANVWGMIVLGLLGLAIVVAVAYMIFERSIELRKQLQADAELLKPLPEPARPMPKINKGVVVSQSYNSEAGYVGLTSESWPCKPNEDDPENSYQFDELARHAVSHAGRLIVRAFDGQSSNPPSTWKRDEFTIWRKWAENHKPPYVVPGRDGGYYATSDLMRIFRAYVDRKGLPLSIEFNPNAPILRDLAAHTRDEHARVGRGGVAAEGFEPLPGSGS